MDMIAIIDLGIGNLSNVKKITGGRITRDKDTIESSDKIIVPGVGNFSSVMNELEPLKDTLISSIKDGKPYLGICLGMQILFGDNEESGTKGLQILDGDVVSFREELRPHIGWNTVIQKEECELMKGIEDESYFYFVHSFYIDLDEDIAVTEHSDGKFRKIFPSIICRDNIYGVQFHPEKSSEAGIKLIKNFKEL
ncbi:MAG: imidazole glycerol phosphate synthase subunit HisH [Thermoplasmatota archaeon]